MISTTWTHLKTAIEMFRTQKFRFALTVSGIVVGTGSLLIMASLLSVGQEVLRRASSEATGEDIVTVQNDWRVVMDNPDAKGLEAADLDALTESSLLPADRSVSAEYGPEQRKGLFEGEEFTPATMGILPNALDLHRLVVARGRPFSDDEVRERRRVVLAGSKVLDGELDPGDVVRIAGTPFVVIGVLEEKPEMGPGGPWSWNNRLIMPATTYRLQFAPGGAPDDIVVRVAPPITYDGLLKDYVVAASDLIDVVLMRGRTVKSWRFEGLNDDSSTEVIVMNTIRALLYLTTVFSMVVGGINIMNIMLVTVAERTREIGTRRALGATRNDVMRQFLAETVMVTLVGAVIGVIGAVVILAAGSAAMNAWVTTWPFRIVPWSVGVAVAFSSGIGLVFGLYPAWRASRLDPVEALRFE
ncbi:MAG: ABC transporter permease [Myxococcota bacterium]